MSVTDILQALQLGTECHVDSPPAFPVAALVLLVYWRVAGRLRAGRVSERVFELCVCGGGTACVSCSRGSLCLASCGFERLFECSAGLCIVCSWVHGMWRLSWVVIFVCAGEWVGV